MLRGSVDPFAVTKYYVQEYVEAQTNIGWSQIFQGRLVTNWAILQEDFLETNNATLKLDRRYSTGAI